MKPMKTKARRILAAAACLGIVLARGPLASAASPEALFAKHCIPCHGKDGKAQSPAARKLGVKDLSQSKATDSEIEKQLIEGRKDNRGNLKMPPFRDKLSPDEIKSLIVLVKGFRK